MKKFSLIALTALAVILAGCGGTGSARSTTIQADLGDFPAGNYMNTILAWTLDFKADGSYLAGGPQVVENGVFTVDGNQISFKGSYCGDATGIYTWSYDGTALEFEQVHDECLERAGTVVTGKWVERP